VTDPERIAVVHLGPDPALPGGMHSVIRDLLASPLAESYALEAIATYRGRKRVGRLVLFGRAMVALARWCRRPGARVVHIHSAVRGSLYRKSLCVLVAKLARRPVILHLHAGSGDIEAFVGRIGPVRRTLFRRAMLAADRVLSVSRDSADALGRCFDVHGVVVVPNAAPGVPADAMATARAGLEVLYLGGFFDPAKGGDVYVRALRSLAPRHPEVSWALAGPGEAPPEVARAGHNVRWLGWLDEEAKLEALQRCRLFVLPSVSEGLPVALLEAMAWGRAIVASEVGGVPDVLTDGVNARLVPPGDAPALTAAVDALLDDRDERDRLAAAARDRAAALNHDEVCGRLDSVYRELAG